MTEPNGETRAAIQVQAVEIKHLTDAVDKLTLEVKALRADIYARGPELAVHTEQIRVLRADMDSLTIQSRAWAGLNSAAAVVAGLLGINK